MKSGGATIGSGVLRSGMGAGTRPGWALDRGQFAGLVGMLGAFAALLLLLFWLAGSRQEFSLYGWAAVALLLILPLTRVLVGRLRAQRRSRWWAALVILPLAILALGQISYWLAFFSSPDRAIGLGIGREMIAGTTGPLLWPAGLMLLVAWGWVFASLLRRDG